MQTRLPHVRPAWLACLATLTLAIAAPAADKYPKCFDASREGDCVAVTVNGQRAVKLTKQTKKMLEARGALKFDGDITKFEIPQPVRGELKVDGGWLPEAQPFFGADAEVTVMVFPLDGQDLETRPELSSDSSVRIGGSPVVTRSDVIQGNKLPAGKYLLSVRVSSTNWDRATVFVQVVD